MAEKKIKTRIQNKHDIEANWAQATNFIPLAGELIVYDIDDEHPYQRFKFGDGVVQADGTIVGTNVNDLPFADARLNEDYIGKAHGAYLAVDDVSPIAHALDVTVASKNLIDLSHIIGKTYNSNGGKLTVGDDGGITGSGTPTGNVATSFNLNVPKDKLTLSASGTFTNIQCGFYLYDAADTVLKTIMVNETSRNATIDVTDYPTFSYAKVDIKRKSNNVEMSGTAYFQIEAGETATEYTPYVDVEGVTVKCADTLYSENAQTVTADADGTVTGLTSIAPNMTLWTEGGVIEEGETLEKLYFDTSVNIDEHLASLTYETSGSYAGSCQLITNPSYKVLIATDLGISTGGGINGYTLSIAYLSSAGTIVDSITPLYSSVKFDLSSYYSGYRADKIGWQMDSIDYPVTVYNLYDAFTLFNGTVVRDEPNGIIINVEYYKDYYESIIQADIRSKEYAKIQAAEAQATANIAYSLAESKVGSLSDLGITATTTELNYIDGVTSSVQNQLDSKLGKSENAVSATKISKAVQLGSSSSNADNKYRKFGTITLTKAWDTCSGTLLVHALESTGHPIGMLNLFIRASSTIASQSVNLVWTSLNEDKYKDTISLVKISDGVFDLYYKNVATYAQPEIIGIFDKGESKIVLADGGSWVSEITPTYTSRLSSTASTAIKATQDASGNVITETYATKKYVDDAKKAVKDDLLNGAGEAYDTLKELGELIDTNVDAIEALEEIATGKADKKHTHAISDVTNLQSTLDKKVESLSDLAITATATELNYLKGVTSNVQAQLNEIAESKAAVQIIIWEDDD